ncbi:MULTISPECIES: nucleoside deaminase [Paenibacillus]|uniref:Zinc-binding CMP-dCMP deaminase n=1 Tax=Paenibacillus illinoisensis TaxID=59845 RepID=A0A2W0CP14_9BACL|nr:MULTISPECIES: nucleoside deaminase [Paenibacillus]PAD29955.1 tRNA-specific adenosine deaminase [Paenibacillus sp. 7523-1]PYY29935.1 Zinc-binding CMP-dCMP deaminase [Paenibacillus illinoisensis]
MRLSDYEYLVLALEEADQAFIEGTYPIGAVIVDEDGDVLSKGRNRVFSECDPTAHAEVDAIRRAGKHLLDLDRKKFTKNNLTLYTTCEPCPMCSCTILMSGIKRIVWAADDEEYGGLRRFKEGPHFIHMFDTLSCVAAPYLDLENRQRAMLAEWNISRGLLNTEWETAKQ